MTSAIKSRITIEKDLFYSIKKINSLKKMNIVRSSNPKIQIACIQLQEVQPHSS